MPDVARNTPQKSLHSSQPPLCLPLLGGENIRSLLQNFPAHTQRETEFHYGRRSQTEFGNEMETDVMQRCKCGSTRRRNDSHPSTHPSYNEGFAQDDLTNLACALPARPAGGLTMTVFLVLRNVR